MSEHSENGSEKKRLKRYLKKQESWQRFALKASLMLSVLFIAGAAFASRYRIGYDPQVLSCIPEFNVYLLDLKDRSLERGALFAFKAERMEPVWEEGTRMVKYLYGMPGDRVEIDRYERVFINGENVATGLFVAHKVGKRKKDFMGKGELAEDSYWFFGSSPTSFDSRYWGHVHSDQVIGRVYPIF